MEWTVAYDVWACHDTHTNLSNLMRLMRFIRNSNKSHFLCFYNKC